MSSMLREGLRAEVPELFALARRLPRPTVAATSPWWAALAAIGIAYIAGSLVSAALVPVLSDPRWTGPRPLEIGNALGTAVGTIVAFRAGRRAGLLRYVGYVVALAALDLARTLLALQQCGTIFLPLSCDVFDPWRALARHWTGLSGVAVGLLGRDATRRGTGRTNGLLEGAGAYALGPMLVITPVGFVQSFPARPSLGEGSANAELVAIVALEVLAGSFVLASRAARPLLAAAALGAVVIAGWLPLGVFQVQTALAAGWTDARLAIVVYPALAAALLVVVTAVWRRTVRAFG